MNWDSLKDLKCPQCRSFLVTANNFYNCSECEFKISEKKFNQIVDKMYKRGLNLDMISERDNLSALNNL